MNKRHMWNVRGPRRAVTGGVLGLVMMGGGLAGAAERTSPLGEQPLPKVQLTCVGSARTVFSPALSPSSQSGSMIFSSRYGGCLSLGGLGVSSASVSNTADSFKNYTCTDALGSPPEKVTVTWNNGETSELSLQPAEVHEESTTTTVSYTGEVVKGKFKGFSVVRSFTYLNSDFNGRCLSTSGLTETNALSFLVLARVN
ncbi:hypothetical protein [Melittangium boletus]|uniref:Uncharacterized protein n=1 Tax=Melittangium boletus DSM 14713 TaxID=1294270 RepID=A0A250I7N6_9BACT|nr:hypothetical protein [Melittangium boletus]ATB27182.1 hypothetical protein MEBOL_000620 [Melittangium boletus DSM 14713]